MRNDKKKQQLNTKKKEKKISTCDYFISWLRKFLFPKNRKTNLTTPDKGIPNIHKSKTKQTKKLLP